jgi:hypothetical protein
VFNGGVYTKVRNPSGLRGNEGTWGVVGPYPIALHCGATWQLKSEESAELWAGRMNAGQFPTEEDLDADGD